MEIQNAGITQSGLLLNAVGEMDSLTNGTKSYQSWVEPIPFQAAPKEHIDLDCLPEVFADMCRAISESLTVSTDMVAAAGLGVLSMCCNKHLVCLKDGWFQPITLYMVGCAAAGEKKSPVLNALKKPVDDWVTHHNIDLKPQVAASKQRYKNLKSKLKMAEKALENGKGDEAETIRLAQELDAFEEIHPIRLYTGDTTSEKLTDLLKENGERFAILSSEGGILKVLTGQYSDGMVNSDIYCMGYNGETVGVDRVNRGTVVMENPVLTLTLFIQPVILSEILSNSMLQGVGFLDRCLFYAPPSTIGKEKFSSSPVPLQVQTAYSNLVQRLLNQEQRRTLWLSPDAREQFAEWYDQFTADIPFVYGDLTGWASKFRGTVGRIAAVLQMCEDDSNIITGDNMFRAVVLSDYFAEQARMLLRSGGLNQNEQTARYILGRLKALKSKTYTDDEGRTVLPYRVLRQNVHRKGLQKKSDYSEPLQLLLDMGYVDLDGDSFERVTSIFVNPAVWSEQQ